MKKKHFKRSAFLSVAINYFSGSTFGGAPRPGSSNYAKHSLGFSGSGERANTQNVIFDTNPSFLVTLSVT